MDDDRLENRFGNPVDGGTNVTEPEGELLTWEEFSDLSGSMRLKCLKKGTHVNVHLGGLAPGGVYTIWIVAFHEGGFIPNERDIEKALKNIKGAAPFGGSPGDKNDVTAAASGVGQVTAITPNGTMLTNPFTGERAALADCMLDEYEVHLVAVLHLDGETHGDLPEPEGAGSLRAGRVRPLERGRGVSDR